MKILTVVKDLDKGGTQRGAQNFCEGYKNLGHSSRIYALSDIGCRKKELIRKSIYIYTNESQETFDDIKDWHPDIVHIHSHDMHVSVVLRLKKILPNSKFIETNVFSTLSDYTSCLDYSFQLSNWCSYLYLSRGGALNKLRIVPNPIRTDAFYRSDKRDILAFKQKYGLPEDAFIFGRIGQSYSGKWSFYLIDLFEKFLSEVSENAYLLIVNPPNDIVHYTSLKSNILDKIIIIDTIRGDHNLRVCYSSIDMFLHIAKQGESFGMVLAESILCETPVITLNTPWGDNSQKEVIEHNMNGFCANTTDEFFSYMKDFYRRNLLLQASGKQGRESIIDRYDYIFVANEALKVFSNNFVFRINFEVLLKRTYKNKADKMLMILLLLMKYKIKAFKRIVNFLLMKRFNITYR
ncbi:MAG: glycosyltransferase family 4 protein [Cyclobacteriaceae bacterium]